MAPNRNTMIFESEENKGNLDPNYVPEYDWLKIRRRCEEKMRTMDDNPRLLEVARLLKIKLD